MTGKVLWFQGVLSVQTVQYDILSFNVWLVWPWETMGNWVVCVSVLEETLENNWIFLIIAQIIQLGKTYRRWENQFFIRISSGPWKVWTAGRRGEIGPGVTGRGRLAVGNDDVGTGAKWLLWWGLLTRKVPWFLMDGRGVVRIKFVGLWLMLCPNSMLVTPGITCLPISTRIGLGPCRST